MVVMNIQQTHRITAKVDTHAIPLGALRHLINGLDDEATIVFTPITGGDQRDPSPVGTHIVIELPSKATL